MCTWGPIYGCQCNSLTRRPFADLTDVTLADEDTNSILTEDVNRTIQGNENLIPCNITMKVAPPGGQIVTYKSGSF